MEVVKEQRRLKMQRKNSVHYRVKTHFDNDAIACSQYSSWWRGIEYLLNNSALSVDKVTCGNCLRTKVFKKN